MVFKSLFFTVSLSVFLVSVLGCNRVADTVSTQSSSAQQADLKTLNTSIGNSVDASSTAKAIQDLEAYVQKKTNTSLHLSGHNDSTFSIKPDLKQKLVKAELSLHPTMFASRQVKFARLSQSASPMSREAYIEMKKRESMAGLSFQDVADALNQAISDVTYESSGIQTAAIKVANKIEPFTAQKINLMRDKAMSLLPASGDPSSERISPIQAMIIGYMIASNDDGTKQDGDVRFFADQALVDAFLNNILIRLEQ